MGTKLLARDLIQGAEWADLDLVSLQEGVVFTSAASAQRLKPVRTQVNVGNFFHSLSRSYAVI